MNVPQDIMTAWCYPLEKRVTLSLSDVRKRKQTAFTLTECEKMLNRKKLAMERAILAGHVKEPQYTYGLNEQKKKFKYMLNEENLLEFHEHFSNVHFGRPRKDGKITPKPMPTVRELRAMIRQEEPLYVRGDDGEFRPVWRADNF